MFAPTATYHSYIDGNEAVYEIIVEPNNNILTFASSLPDIKLLSFPDLKFLGTLKGHTHFTSKMKFLNNGKLLMSTSDDGTSILWDLATMKQISIISPGIGELSSMDTLDNSFVLGGEKNIALGKFSKPIRILEDYHSDIVRQVLFHGKNLISSSDDGCINQYDLSTNNEDDMLFDVMNIGNGIKKFGFCDQSIIHILSQTQILSLWNIQNNKVLCSTDRSSIQCDYFIDSICSNNELNLFTGMMDGNFEKLSLNNELKPQRSIKFENGHTDNVGCVWWDGKVMLSGADDGKVILWSVKGNQKGRDSSLKEVKSKTISNFKPY